MASTSFRHLFRHRGERNHKPGAPGEERSAGRRRTVSTPEGRTDFAAPKTWIRMVSTDLKINCIEPASRSHIETQIHDN